jgi:hypothetical protein
MERKEVIQKLKKYFNIKELVSRKVFGIRGELAWGEFDSRLLETILVIRRDILKVPMVVNNWSSGGSFEQRGFRENLSAVVKQKTDEGILYMSAHNGKAIDFSSPKMTADEMRTKIVENQNKLPYPIRLEKKELAPTWVHIDVRVDDLNCKNKINWF